MSGFNVRIQTYISFLLWRHSINLLEQNLLVKQIVRVVLQGGFPISSSRIIFCPCGLRLLMFRVCRYIFCGLSVSTSWSGISPKKLRLIFWEVDSVSPHHGVVFFVAFYLIREQKLTSILSCKVISKL